MENADECGKIKSDVVCLASFIAGHTYFMQGSNFLLLKQKEYKRRIDMSAARRKRKPVEAEEKKEKDAATRYTPDYRKGLTSQQVQEHKLHGWTNQAVDSTSKTTKEIVQENVFTYFNLIFLVLAVLLCLVGAFRDLTFLPVIIANTLIGIIQEIRAKKVLDDLTMLNAPHAMVVRDGKNP